jgi:hypothetical protein
MSNIAVGEEVADEVLAENFSLSPVPVGFAPLGESFEAPEVDPGQIPQTKDELSELLSFTYDLTVTRAGELNIPIVGSVSGGFNRRVIVYEWTRFKELTGRGSIKYRFGYVIRFCLTVSKWEVQGKLSLPFLTAQAELGNIEASWLMQVRGLIGPKIDSVVLPPQDLKVETFVIAKQSLNSAIAAISDPKTKYVPGIVLASIDPNAPSVAYWLSAVKAFAIDSARRGRTGAQTMARLGTTDPAANDVITEVYNFLGITNPNQVPDNPARENAAMILRGIKADV